MVCGKSNRNINFNQIYILGYFNSLPPCLNFWLSFLLLSHILIIKLSGDTELNLDIKPSSRKKLSICYLNLNSITSHGFVKVKLWTGYSALHSFDIICMTESYFNSQTLSSYDNLSIPGYNIYHADHLSGNRCLGVSITYKEPLFVKMLIIYYLQRCICFDLKLVAKFAILYAFIDHKVKQPMNLTNLWTT